MSSPVPQVVLESQGPARRIILARTAVFHAVRDQLRGICDLTPYTLHGRKALADLLIAAQSLPEERVSPPTEDARWLAGQWAASLRQTLDYTMLDDAYPDRTRRTCEVLGKALIALEEIPDDNPFENIFVRVCRLSAAVYRDRWRVPTLRVSHINRHPRGQGDAHDPYSVTAATNTTEGLSPYVWVTFYLQDYGPETYAALPWLLVHECVCHVASGHEDVDNNSPFAEGFMDWASRYFFDLWVQKIDPGLSQAARVHGYRLADFLQHRSPEGAARAEGASAAQDLADWLTDVWPDDPPRAQRTVADLAIALNVTEQALWKKDLLIPLFRKPLDPDVEGAILAWAEREQAVEVLLDLAKRVS